MLLLLEGALLHKKITFYNVNALLYLLKKGSFYIKKGIFITEGHFLTQFVGRAAALLDFQLTMGLPLCTQERLEN